MTNPHAHANRSAAALVRDLDKHPRILAPEVAGWAAWSLVRWNLHVASLPFITASRGQPAVSRLKHLAATGAASALSWCQLLSLKGPETLAISHASSLHEQDEHHRWRDVHLETLDHVPSLRLIRMDNPLARERVRNARLPPAATLTGIDVAISWGSRVPHAEADHAAKDLFAALPPACQAVMPLTRIQRDLRRFVVGRALWRRQLPHWGTRRVVVVDATSDYSLIAAARERGCHVLELQHGAIDDAHPSFSWHPSLIPQRHRLVVPDAVGFYGTYWRDLVHDNGYRMAQLLVVGCPSIQRRRAQRRVPETVCVVVTAQPFDGLDLHEFIAQVARPLGHTVTWQIRLHPTWRGGIESLLALYHDLPQVTVTRSGEGPSTSQRLAQASWHVSISSTCHYEALALGVPTVVLDLPGMDTAAHLVRDGEATLVRTPQELSDMLARHSPEIPPAIGERYYSKTVFPTG